MEGRSKKVKGLMVMDNSVVTVGGGVEVEEDVRGIHGNGKNTIKEKFK